MTGRRVDDKGTILEPGEYGKQNGVWHCCAPRKTVDDFPFVGNLSRHEVTEHEDGTITVSPSILINAGKAGAWHGFLERGIWREC